MVLFGGFSISTLAAERRPGFYEISRFKLEMESKRLKTAVLREFQTHLTFSEKLSSGKHVACWFSEH
jgi:hypothetical protein